MPGAGEMGSKAYKARIAKSAGLTCSKPFESDFGKKILLKYGWKEGTGLGARNQGRTGSIQATRREVGSGLGHEKRKPDDQWDNWWSACFNNIAKKAKTANVETASKAKFTNSNDDSDDDSDSDDGKTKDGARITAVKSAKVMGGKLRRVLRQETVK